MIGDRMMGQQFSKWFDSISYLMRLRTKSVKLCHFQKNECIAKTEK
jgi:hypothetical protein